jgi:hypothetical protein
MIASLLIRAAKYIRSITSIGKLVLQVSQTTQGLIRVCKKQLLLK